MLDYFGNECEINMGSNCFTAVGQGSDKKLVPIIIDDTPLIGFSIAGNQLFLNLKIFNESNTPILEIIENELVYRVSSWDIQFEGTHLTICEAQKKILIKITFTPPNQITINRGRFMFNGAEVLISPKSMIVASKPTMFTGCTFRGVTHGLAIGNNPKLFSKRGVLIGCRFQDISRYLKNYAELLKWEREAFSN